MTATIEERLNSLAQMVETIASEMNNKNSPEQKRDPVPVPEGYRRVTFSTNVADYDFSEVEARLGATVVEIVDLLGDGRFVSNDGPVRKGMRARFSDGKTRLIKPLLKAPGFAQEASRSRQNWVKLSTDATDYDLERKKGSQVVKIIRPARPTALLDEKGSGTAMLVVQLTNGKEVTLQFPIAKGHKLKAVLPSVEKKALAAASISTVSNDSELELVALAAFNIEAKSSHRTAWAHFCATTHGKGAAHCVSIARPLLATTPCANDALPHQKVIHLRTLLVQRLAPDVEKSAPQQASESVVQRPSVTPLTHRAILERDRLEKALVPERVNGKWVIPSIGAEEQEWLESPALQHEFPCGARSYAAYCRRYGKPEIARQ